jgi:hypothetical protein
MRLAQSGLDHSTPVYALLVPSERNDEEIQRLPSIKGYTWRRNEKSGTKAVVMTLTKSVSDQF